MLLNQNKVTKISPQWRCNLTGKKTQPSLFFFFFFHDQELEDVKSSTLAEVIRRNTGLKNIPRTNLFFDRTFCAAVINNQCIPRTMVKPEELLELRGDALRLDDKASQIAQPRTYNKRWEKWVQTICKLLWQILRTPAKNSSRPGFLKKWPQQWAREESSDHN